MGLYEKLKAYGDSDYYGFHMPGHKRKTGGFANLYSLDITEVNGFDDLHHPQKDGILTKAQERSARLYGSGETHFLINGSTAGILSAICACTKKGGKILAARNCHRSVYHGIALGNLEAAYIYPQQECDLWINGSIYPQDVDKALENFPEAQAVILTSPTYDGICSDVEKIARIVHRRGIPLLVDQAHGAHFHFHRDFPQDAVSQGADIVVHSIHKTLPSLTQTALLHVNGDLVDRRRLAMFLSVYQSSSPSYILMAGIDKCMEFLETQGEEAFDRQVKALRQFYEDCRTLKRIRLMDENIRDGKKVWDMDFSRLLFSVKGTPWSGNLLGERLLREYNLQMEMSTVTYSLGISSVADTAEGFERLKNALLELDKELDSKMEKNQEITMTPPEETLTRPHIEMTISAALDSPLEKILLKNSCGRIAGTFVYQYPPGIPLLAPGEIITREILGILDNQKKGGVEIQGLEEDKQIYVLKK